MPGCQWRKRGGKAREQSWTPRRPAALRVWGSGRQLARRGVLGKPAGSPVQTAWDSAVRSPRRLLNGQNPPPCPKWLFPGEQHCWGRAGWPPRVRGAPEATGNPVRDRAAQVAAPWLFTLGPDPEFELAQWTAGKGPRSAPAPLFYPICETSIGEIFLSLIESLFLCGAEGARFPERAWGERAGVGWEGVAPSRLAGSWETWPCQGQARTDFTVPVRIRL